MLRVKKYYVTGNTAQGQIDLVSSNVQGMKKVIKLDHPSYKWNTAILQKMMDENVEKTSVEILKSPISSNYLEGIILRDKQIAILGKRSQPISQAYKNFAAGLEIHDKLEQIYIQEMDFKKADDQADELLEQLLKSVPKKIRETHVYRRFLGTNTMDGIVNEVPHIISPLDTIYHIKGRAGTGKSTFMKKIAAACLDHGLDIELYYCSFDSNSIDMVLVPELNICLFDSTDPHAFQPKDLEREKIIDLYDIAVTPGTDEKYAKEITALTQQYKGFMKKGLHELKLFGEEILRKEADVQFSHAELDGAWKEIQTKISE